MTQREKIFEFLCRAISLVLHPFLVPSYIIMVIVLGQNNMWFLSEGSKVTFILIIFGTTFAIPAMMVSVMHFFGLANIYLTNRSEKTFPLIVTALGYLLALWLLRDVLVASLIRTFIFSAVTCIWIAIIVNYFWKISLHMIAIGGAFALLSLIAISSTDVSITDLSIATLLCGGLASARVYMNHHSLTQVGVGFFVGFTTSSIIILFV